MLEIKSLYAQAGNPKHASKPQRRYEDLLFSFGRCGIVIQVKEETSLVNLNCSVEKLVRIEDW